MKYTNEELKAIVAEWDGPKADLAAEVLQLRDREKVLVDGLKEIAEMSCEDRDNGGHKIAARITLQKADDLMTDADKVEEAKRRG
jgi:hypothetical protein